MAQAPETALKGVLNIGFTVMLLACVAVILASAAESCLSTLHARPETVEA